jgi:hypothetical protein
MCGSNGFADAMPLLIAPDLERSVLRWYTAYTWSRHEKSLAKQLEERRPTPTLESAYNARPAHTPDDHAH